MAHLNLVTLPHHAPEDNGPLLNHFQKINARVTASLRRELFCLHLSDPAPDRLTAHDAVLAELSRGLSGGDILNVCVNVIHAVGLDADSAKWKVTQGMLEREIGKARKAKAEHSGETEGTKRRIGFQPG